MSEPFGNMESDRILLEEGESPGYWGAVFGEIQDENKRLAEELARVRAAHDAAYQEWRVTKDDLADVDAELQRVKAAARDYLFRTPRGYAIGHPDIDEQFRRSRDALEQAIDEAAS